MGLNKKKRQKKHCFASLAEASDSELPVSISLSTALHYRHTSLTLDVLALITKSADPLDPAITSIRYLITHKPDNYRNVYSKNSVVLFLEYPSVPKKQ